MENLALEYKKQYKASRQKMESIADDPDMKLLSKRQKIDEEKRRIEKVAKEYRHKAMDAIRDEISNAEKSLFNLKTGGVDGYNRDAKMNKRDAIDRSLRYDKEQLSEAYQMFSDAEDSTMTGAIAYRAYKKGNRDVLDSYLNEDEFRRESYQDLQSAKQRLSPGTGSAIPSIQSSFMTPGRPPIRD